MARNVYFDPFGSRVEGYRAGVQDEQAVQGAVRGARQLDWDYNNMNPIRLDVARRANAFGAYDDQFRRAESRRDDFVKEAAVRGDIGIRTNNAAPLQNLDAGYLQPEVRPNPDGTTVQGYTNPAGVFQPLDFNNQTYLESARIVNPNYLNYMNANAQLDAQRFMTQAQLDAARYAAEAEMYGKQNYNDALMYQSWASNFANNGGAGGVGSGYGGVTGQYNGYSPFGLPTWMNIPGMFGGAPAQGPAPIPQQYAPFYTYPFNPAGAPAPAPAPAPSPAPAPAPAPEAAAPVLEQPAPTQPVDIQPAGPPPLVMSQFGAREQPTVNDMLRSAEASVADRNASYERQEAAREAARIKAAWAAIKQTPPVVGTGYE